MKTKKTNKLIPLGSACRLAWQINKFNKNNDIQKTSYPIDWCVTSNKSLEILFSDDFDITKVLSNIIKVHSTGNCKCEYTDIVFPHGVKFPIDDKQVNQAKQRFYHTYQHYKSLRYMNDITFIRWYPPCRKVRPRSIINSLKNFLQHENFKFIHVETEVFDEEKNRPIDQFELISSPHHYKLYELRPDPTTPAHFHFRGDSKSWDSFLSHLTKS